LRKKYFNTKKKRKDSAIEAEKIRLNKIKNEARGNKIQQGGRLN
tara:strand:- start:20 stop:151 length:132 start_codon:yes stop_codon:yes gene_type:complete